MPILGTKEYFDSFMQSRTTSSKHFANTMCKADVQKSKIVSNTEVTLENPTHSYSMVHGITKRSCYIVYIYT